MSLDVLLKDQVYVINHFLHTDFWWKQMSCIVKCDTMEDDGMDALSRNVTKARKTLVGLFGLMFFPRKQITLNTL